VIRNASTTAIVSTKSASVHPATWEGTAIKLCAFLSALMVEIVRRRQSAHVLKDFKEDTAKAVSNETQIDSNNYRYGLLI
jgi:hypothetical protein